MKVKKFTENIDKADIREEIIQSIADLILDYVDLINVPYTDDMTLDKISVNYTSTEIYKMLLDKGVNFELLKNTNKYNI